MPIFAWTLFSGDDAPCIRPIDSRTEHERYNRIKNQNHISTSRLLSGGVCPNDETSVSFYGVLDVVVEHLKSIRWMA